MSNTDSTSRERDTGGRDSSHTASTADGVTEAERESGFTPLGEPRAPFSDPLPADVRTTTPSPSERVSDLDPRAPGEP